MISLYLLLTCIFLSVSCRPYEDRFEFKDREKEEIWRPVYGAYDDRLKPIKNKDKYDDKFLIESTRPYYPGLFTFPYYFWEAHYRPTYPYPEVNYFIKKEIKEKSNLKKE